MENWIHRAVVAIVVLVALFLVDRTWAAAPAPKPQEGLSEYLDVLDALENAKFDDAVAASAKAIDADEENADYYTARGVALMLAQKPKDGETVLDRSLKLRPGDKETLMWKASAVAMQGDFMREGNVGSPFAVHGDEYFNEVRRMSHEYGQAAFAEANAKRDGYEADIQYAKQQAAVRDQVVKTKFPQIAAAFAAKMKGKMPSIEPLLRERVKKLLAQKDYAGAMKEINHLLAAKPNDAELLLFHASAALPLGAPEIARRDQTRGLTVWPQLGDIYLARAVAAAQTGDLKRAQTDLTTAETLKANGVGEIRSSVGSIPPPPTGDATAMLMKLHDDAKAGGTWDDLVKSATDIVRLTNATRLRADEQYQDGLRVLTLAVKAQPNSADAHAALGQFLYEQASCIRGESVEPRAEYRTYRWITQDSRAAEIDRAMQEANAALQIDPKNVSAMATKAAVLIWGLKWGDAETVIKQALAIKPDDARVLKLFADVMDHAAAMKAAKAANLRETKTWSDAFYIYTRWPSQSELDAADQYDSQAQQLWALAEKTIQEAAKVKKGTADGFYYEALIARRDNNAEAMTAALEKCVELAPNVPDYHEQLGQLYSIAGRNDDAIRQQSIASNLVNTTAGQYLHLAWQYLPRTKYKSARAALDEAAKIDPADARIAMYQGTISQAKEQPDDAAAWFQAATALEEANARMQGKSMGSDASRGLRLVPNDIGPSLACNLRAGELLMKIGKPQQAIEMLKLNTAIESRVAGGDFYTLMPRAMLPDAQEQMEMVPQADHFAYYMAWTHLNIGRSLIAMKQPKQAFPELQRVAAYRENKPPTIDCGTHINIPVTTAQMVLARALYDSGNVAPAKQIVMMFNGVRPAGVPQDVADDFKNLQDQLNSAQAEQNQSDADAAKQQQQQQLNDANAQRQAQIDQINKQRQQQMDQYKKQQQQADQARKQQQQQYKKKNQGN